MSGNNNAKQRAQAKEAVAADAGANEAVAEEAPVEALETEAIIDDTGSGNDFTGGDGELNPVGPEFTSEKVCVTCGSTNDLFTTDGRSAVPMTFCRKHKPANLR